MNKTLMERARALLNDSELPQYMWGEAVLTATYLINRSPTFTVNKLPIEMWTKKKPNLTNIQTFGTIAYSRINSYLKKLENRAKETILLGYCPHGYRLWDPIKNRVILSRDVTFTDLPGHSLFKNTKDSANIRIKFREEITDEGIRAEIRQLENIHHNEEQNLQQNNENDQMLENGDAQENNEQEQEIIQENEQEINEQENQYEERVINEG